MNLMTNGVTMDRIVKLIFCLFILGIILVSCQSVPKNIPQDLTADELTILAQRCFDSSNYKGSEAYYQAIIDRYGTDITLLVSSEYEIAHLYIKQKKWDKAQIKLNLVISYYDDSLSGILPPEYLKLAQIDLEKIPQ